MSKSRFDGSTLGNGRWDEEEHPRGKDGRFVSDGGEMSGEEAEEKFYHAIKNDDWESAERFYVYMKAGYGDDLTPQTRRDLEELLRKRDKRMVEVNLDEY